jgi:hypothetical protein
MADSVSEVLKQEPDLVPPPEPQIRLGSLALTYDIKTGKLIKIVQLLQFVP